MTTSNVDVRLRPAGYGATAFAPSHENWVLACRAEAAKQRRLVGASGIDPDLEQLSAAKGLIRPSRALHLRPDGKQRLAICTGLEPVSPHGQCGSLTRCFADLQLVRLVRLERTLHGFSNRCLCRWATGANWRTTTGTIRVLRFKRPPHHLNACGPVIVADPGGFDPLGDGLKGRSLSIRV